MNAIVIESPAVNGHSRDTFLKVPAAVAYGEQTQPHHGHHALHFFEAPNRFGESSCTGCGMKAWAPEWVADGVWDDETVRTYIAKRKADAIEAVDASVLTRLRATRMQPVALAAPDAPAKVVGRREPKHRARRQGVMVPSMARVQ